MKADVMALAVKERRQDAKRTREHARRIQEPIVCDHLLEMAADLDAQAEMLERARHTREVPAN